MYVYLIINWGVVLTKSDKPAIYGEKYEKFIRSHIKVYKNYQFALKSKDMAVANRTNAQILLDNDESDSELRKLAKKLIVNSGKLLKEIDGVMPELEYKANQSAAIILENYKKMIYKLVNYYKKTRKDLRDADDLQSSAMIAFTKAIQGFDLNKNIKFSTYLTNGGRNEIIGAYRRGVRQAEVEPCNVSEYFYQNDKAVELTSFDSACDMDPHSTSNQYEIVSNCDSFNELALEEETLEVSEFLRNIPELTLEESIAFMMHAAIDNNHYTKKDMKRMFNLGESYLDSSKLKVFSAYQARDMSKLRNSY